MKRVVQLDSQGYFAGFSMSEESPLEPGVWLMPAGCVEAPEPDIPHDHKAKWDKDEWVFEAIQETPEEVYTPSEEDKIVLCKSVAARLLLNTDFSQYADVIPLLDNYEEFVVYRSEIRNLFLNPIAEPEWPAPPVASWK